MCERRGASFRAELAAVRACEPGGFSSSADGSSFCAWLRSGAGASCLHGSDGRAGEAAQLAGSGRRHGSGGAFSCSLLRWFPKVGCSSAA